MIRDDLISPDRQPRPHDPLHEKFMIDALEEAEKGLDEGEVPVGAVIIHDNMVIGRGHNLMETLRDPTAHAEIIAIGAAADHLRSWRLEYTALYCTLEPCPMCAGAIVQARIPLLVYGARDPKRGCCGSILDIVREKRFNHMVEVIPDVLADRSGQLLQNFFKTLRTEH